MAKAVKVAFRIGVRDELVGAGNTDNGLLLKFFLISLQLLLFFLFCLTEACNAASLTVFICDVTF